MTQNRKILLIAGAFVILAVCCAGASLTSVMLAARAYSAFSSDEMEPARSEFGTRDQSEAPRGLLITAVDPDGVAARAGLRRGDIILSLNGVDTDRIDTLRRILRSREPGDRIVLTIAGDGRDDEVTITLGDQNVSLGINVAEPQVGAPPLNPPLRPPAPVVTPPAPPTPLPGLPETAPSESPFDFSFSGAWVAAVIEDGPAADAGLEAGDVITAIGDSAILNREELLAALRRRSPGDNVGITVRRGDETLSFSVRLGRHPDDPSRAYLGIELAAAFVHPPVAPSRAPDREG